MLNQDDYKSRVNYAARAIVEGINSRAVDSCFEMFDGDIVVTALVRRAAKNPKLHAAICKQWSGKFPQLWIETADKYSCIPTKNLQDKAKEIRALAAARYG